MVGGRRWIAKEEIILIEVKQRLESMLAAVPQYPEGDDDDNDDVKKKMKGMEKDVMRMMVIIMIDDDGGCGSGDYVDINNSYFKVIYLK